MHNERLVIANCGGFWGDDPTAALRQVQGGPVDYLVMDYLAEVTMAILQKQRLRRPETGYAADFLRQLRDVLVECAERGIKIISNAGGVNPLGCKRAVEALAAELGLEGRIKVAAVVGDDLYDRLDELLESGEQLTNIDTGRPLRDIRDSVLAANVYLGAAPIVRALELGADVIVAGRVTDTAVTLAPMIHEFGWAHDDWDRLASGIIAGHIVECGTQCTGGNFTDWKLVKNWSRLGFPLVEARQDGSFVVTKHPDTGGIVSVHTVTEQLLYEMGTPAYLSPDCVAHFDSIQLSQDGPDRVLVTGARGDKPPETLKVSVSFAHGYRAFGRLMISGPDALAKAELVSEIVWECAGGRDLYDDTVTQFVGWDATHPPLAASEPGEILVQFAVRDSDEMKINETFAPQIVPRGLGSVPGITVVADQGRPRASDVVGYWPALIARECIELGVVVGEDEHAVRMPSSSMNAPPFHPPELQLPAASATGRLVAVQLSKLCLARSGDKGDTANVGVIARSPAIYHWMLANLTTGFVKDRFGEVCEGTVERFEVPNLLALNFLLHESLGGGGTLSLLMDAQGKTYAQYLLATTVEVDEGLLPA